MNFLKKLFGKKNYKTEEGNSKNNVSKDPSDYKKDDLSTDWMSDGRYCNECKKSTSHNEYMSDICNSCGNFNTQIRYGRSYRKIYIDGKWKYQVRYRNGDEEIRDSWY
jgi:hypothetical protein